MATSFSCFCSAPVQKFANRLNTDLTRSKPTSGSSSASWWTPLFGWSSEPDYIVDSGSSTSAIKTGPPREVSGLKSDPETGRCRSKFQPGCFTEDKAKELRRKTMQSSNFHDIMYHSAIASRLASDVSGR